MDRKECLAAVLCAPRPTTVPLAALHELGNDVTKGLIFFSQLENNVTKGLTLFLTLFLASE